MVRKPREKIETIEGKVVGVKTRIIHFGENSILQLFNQKTYLNSLQFILDKESDYDFIFPSENPLVKELYASYNKNKNLELKSKVRLLYNNKWFQFVNGKLEYEPKSIEGTILVNKKPAYKFHYRLSSYFSGPFSRYVGIELSKISGK